MDGAEDIRGVLLDFGVVGAKLVRKFVEKGIVVGKIAAALVAFELLAEEVKALGGGGIVRDGCAVVELGIEGRFDMAFGLEGEAGDIVEG